MKPVGERQRAVAAKFKDHFHGNQRADVLLDPGIILQDAAVSTEERLDMHRGRQPLNTPSPADHHQHRAGNDRQVIAQTAPLSQSQKG